MKPISRRNTLSCLGGAALGFAGSSALGAEPITIQGKPVELLLTPVSSRTLRISLLPVSSDSSVAGLAADLAIVAQLTGKPILRTRAVAGARRIDWGRLRVNVTAAPLAILIEDQGGKPIQLLQFDAASGAVSFRNSSGPVFGLGEGGPQFDRRNQQYTMRSGQIKPAVQTEGARMPVPWLVSADGWALFFHQPFGNINLAGAEARFETADANTTLPLDLFLVVSRNPAEILKEYAELTGFPHMPPLWSLGYQQSHRTLASREEVMGEARMFREKNLPCDAMIYLGTGFCPSGWNTGHGAFDWNQKVFPNPPKMIEELHREHFKVAVHITKPPVKLFGRATDSGPEAQDPNNAAHYWATHKDVFRLGVDGWWPDEGDPLGPQSRLARNRMYWEGARKERPGERPWALHRNGYAGMQRYSWLWSGDVDSTWKALAAQIPVGLNTGLSGIPYWGTDIGGFVPQKEYTGELYVRWFQFSAFCPLFRSHGRTWKLHLPWGWNTGDYGVIESPERPDPKELHNAEVEPICRRYLNLRYQLLPYLYSAVRESHETGMPLMRALWLHYPDDPQAVARGDQYLWGRDMLVAPVIEPGATARRLYLPRGAWYDFWTGERIEGGREVVRKVDLATMPLYVRAGSVLPLGPVKQYTEQPSETPLTLRIYPGADGRFALYEDDGTSYAYEQGKCMRLIAEWNDRRRVLKLSIAAGSRLFGPATRDIEIEFAGAGTKKKVNFTGSPVVIQF